MSQDLKQIIREEYLKCAQDPAHFMRKYCYIQHPQRGRVLFNLYPFQDKVLNLWKDNPYDIILKSRQLGISTLAAGYSLWMMIFHEDKNVLCIATKQETAKNMVTKVKFMYDSLPSWLKEKDKPQEFNKLTLRLNNGSQIKATRMMNPDVEGRYNNDFNVEAFAICKRLISKRETTLLISPISGKRYIKSEYYLVAKEL